MTSVCNPLVTFDYRLKFLLHDNDLTRTMKAQFNPVDDALTCVENDRRASESKADAKVEAKSTVKKNADRKMTVSMNEFDEGKWFRAVDSLVARIPDEFKKVLTGNFEHKIQPNFMPAGLTINEAQEYFSNFTEGFNKTLSRMWSVILNPGVNMLIRLTADGNGPASREAVFVHLETLFQMVYNEWNAELKGLDKTNALARLDGCVAAGRISRMPATVVNDRLDFRGVLNDKRARQGAWSRYLNQTSDITRNQFLVLVGYQAVGNFVNNYIKAFQKGQDEPRFSLNSPDANDGWAICAAMYSNAVYGNSNGIKIHDLTGQVCTVYRSGVSGQSKRDALSQAFSGSYINTSMPPSY